MALTLTSRSQVVAGNKRNVYITAAWDSSYASGGESLTAANLGLRTITRLTAEPMSGFVFLYDYTNSVLRAYTQFNTYTATVDIASLATDAIANTQVTVAGALTTDIVDVIPPVTLEAGISIQTAWVSAADTIQVRVSNTSAGTVDAASGTFTFNLHNASGAPKEVKSAYSLAAVTGVRIKAEGT